MVTSKKVQGSEVGNRRREVMEEKGYYFTIPVNNIPKKLRSKRKRIFQTINSTKSEQFKQPNSNFFEISKFQKVRRILKCVF